MKTTPQKNDKVHMTAIKGVEPTLEKTREFKNPRPTDPKHDGKSHGRIEELLTTADELAGTNFYNRNWKFRNADKHFPMSPLLRRIEKCYPNAKGGLLLVDEPKNEQELTDCCKKMVAIRKEKSSERYVFVTEEMELDDAKLLMKLPTEFFEAQLSPKSEKFMVRFKKHLASGKVA